MMAEDRYLERITSLERQLKKAREENQTLKTMISVYRTNSQRLLDERRRLQEAVDGNFWKNFQD